MGFSQAVSNGFNNFFNASGRASRSQFWWYYLCLFIIAGVLSVIGGFLESYSIEQVWIGIIVQCFALILSISILCAGIRRLHDIGKSGWNICWNLLPVIGGILLIVWWCQPSYPGDNQYGPRPE